MRYPHVRFADQFLLIGVDVICGQKPLMFDYKSDTTKSGIRPAFLKNVQEITRKIGVVCKPRKVFHFSHSLITSV